MADPRDLIVYPLETSAKVLDRFIADLAGDDWLLRPTPQANCAAWTIGHLILSERRAHVRLGVVSPEIPGDFDTRFARSEQAAGACDFGDVSMLRPMFAAHRELTIAAINRLTDSQLDAPLANVHPMFGTVRHMLQFIAMHTMMHAGQISTIRRCLGRPPLM